MRLIILSSFLFFAWKCGDWRHWRRYYPTILYFICVDLIYEVLLSHHRLWVFHTTPELPFLVNHTFITLTIAFIVYPSTMLMYLGNYPEQEKLGKRIAYIFLWVGIYTIIEIVTLKVGTISHHYGWNLSWSIIFNITAFSLSRIHYRNPLLAWGLSILMILLLWQVFDPPIKSMP